MRFKKILKFTTDPPREDGKGIVVWQDDMGWYYLNALFAREGPATPFSSIEEIRLYTNEKLVLFEEKDVDFDPFNSLQRNRFSPWEN